MPISVVFVNIRADLLIDLLIQVYIHDIQVSNFFEKVYF
jgi:hypothetical protein